MSAEPDKIHARKYKLPDRSYTAPPTPLATIPSLPCHTPPISPPYSCIKNNQYFVFRI